MIKVILVTEYLNPPYDEGIKKTVYHFYNCLKDNCELKVICKIASEELLMTKSFNTNRLFLSKRIKKEIIEFKPDYIIYFPFVASTFASFIRNWILSKYFTYAINIMVSLQPKPLKNWHKKIIKRIRPHKVLTPSPQLIKILEELEIKSVLLPLYTDIIQFSPLTDLTIKNELREKYKIPKNSFVVSHIGHLNEGRNLKSLIPIQKKGYQVLIIGSSSTPSDAIGKDSLKKDLEKAGIIIYSGYIEKIQEIYQLSDLYIFPVVSQNSSIGMPLSVLEARACGIPVMMTDYGSIKYKLGNDNNSIYYCEPNEFTSSITKNMSTILNKNHISYSIAKLNNEYFKTIKENIL